MNHRVSLLAQLYSSASGKYRKFKLRIDKAIQNKRFQQFSKRKQSALLQRLKKLYHRLKSLQTQLKLAGAGAFVAFAISSNTAIAQNTLGPFTENEIKNPLPPPHKIFLPKPAAVDIDGDGDLDIFVGDGYGYVHFFRNDGGSDKVRRFTRILSTENPLHFVSIGNWAAPAFVDVDGDGDFDALVGAQSGSIYFLRNTGTSTNPVFVEQTGSSNPFDNIYNDDLAFPVFADIDGDGDADLILGNRLFSASPAVRYFKNESGTFQEQTGAANPFDAITARRPMLTFADLDGDGDLDALMGQDAGFIETLMNNNGTFDIVANAPWNPATRTGNPMYDYQYWDNGAPSFADLDGDGDMDLLVGFGVTSKYNEAVVIPYYENTDGAFTLKSRNELNRSPFAGTDVNRLATPSFIDFDNDGDLDVILGAFYDFNAQAYRNDDGTFFPVEHPILDAIGQNDTRRIISVFADIDDDGDKDMFVCRDNVASFFRNNSGTYVEEFGGLSGIFGPGAGQILVSNLSLSLLDFDGDSDLDMIFGSDETPRIIGYLENQGTKQNPNFVYPATQPLSGRTFEANPNVMVVDLDNDGDTDIMVAETYTFATYDYRTRFVYLENIGNGTFIEPGTSPVQLPNINPHSYINFFDRDGDGDLDIVVGTGENYGGKVLFFENTNPPPVTSFNGTTLPYTAGTSVFIDPALTLTDPDNDPIVRAEIAIRDFQPGDEALFFTSTANITGSFNNQTGVLTLTGKTSLANYQAALRTISFQFTGDDPGGRVKNINRLIDFTVYDVDFTTPLTYTKTIDVEFGATSNQPPVIQANVQLPITGTTVTFNLLTIISDPDNNLDPTSVQIIQQPVSGATATLQFVSATVVNLLIDYSGVIFTGTDELRIRVSDIPGLQAEQTLFVPNLNFFVNLPPVIQSNTQIPAPTQGNTVSFNLLTIISDPNNNLDPGSIAIVQQPISGAPASVQFISASLVNLNINYNGIIFTGTDQLRIAASDLPGLQTEQDVFITGLNLLGEIEIYNAVAPNSSGDNKYMRILNLPSGNTVSIYNRWGDEVFFTDGYDSNISSRRFEGLNKNGKTLPSGTYFYKIEIQGAVTLTGYLSLKN